MDFSLNSFWHCGVVNQYCTTLFKKAWAQILSVGDLRWWGPLTMVPSWNKAKCHSSILHNTRTIHHYHHHTKEAKLLAEARIRCNSQWKRGNQRVDDWQEVIDPIGFFQWKFIQCIGFIASFIMRAFALFLSTAIFSISVGLFSMFFFWPNLRKFRCFSLRPRTYTCNDSRRCLNWFQLCLNWSPFFVTQNSSVETLWEDYSALSKESTSLDDFFSSADIKIEHIIKIWKASRVVGSSKN